MTISELMAGVTPKPEYAGIANADDYVLAVDFSGTAENVGEYLVAIDGMTSHAATLEGITSDKTYLHKGPTSSKTATKRTFALAGDRYLGDAFQEALPAHEMKFGKGAAVVRPYVYFCMLTGKGEQGKATIMVGDDTAGEAGASATISATLTAFGEPTAYTYSAPANEPAAE